ncbi:MAG: phospholipase D-like domain-containing protein [Nocardioides sp.]
MRRSLVAMILALASVLTVGALVPLTPVASAAPDNYIPRKGVRFNDPYGSLWAERRILRQIVRTMDSVPRRERIRMAAWSINSPAIADAAIRAHRRGVSVQMIMDTTNESPTTPNPTVRRLINAFRGDKDRPKSRRSWLRQCSGSCRGTKGIPHAKFYLFSRVGKVEDIVMYGSANATEASANIQWNDLHIIKNAPASYSEFVYIFRQMKKDEPVTQGYRRWKHGPFTKYFYPYAGDRPAGDPVLRILRRVKCKGATGGAGVNGRTQIRIAQTAMFGARGIAIAEKIAELQRRGCNIRIVYALFGDEVLRILRQDGGTPVPLTHLAYDSNEDGLYDVYVHLKALAISGRYRRKTDANIVWNGSANWSSVALASDEIVGRWKKRKVTRKYIDWIDYLFTNRPTSWLPDDTVALAKRRGVDPYKLIRMEM